MHGVGHNGTGFQDHSMSVRPEYGSYVIDVVVPSAGLTCFLVRFQ